MVEIFNAEARDAAYAGLASSGYVPPPAAPAGVGANGLPAGWTTATVSGRVFIFDEFGNPVSDFNPPGGGGGGGAAGAAGPDHFFDVSGNQQASLAADRFQFDNVSAYQQAVLSAQREKDAADQAMAQGNLTLAREKEANAQRWQQVAADLQGRGQDMDFQTAQMQIAQAKYASDQQFQVGMANAQNDTQRNAITAQWNQEQAAIAKMDDETKRILGGQANQTAQFGAETGRQVGMGNLALENNKFIADMASGARGADLFSLYFMQRGIAPDWNTMAAGGTPATGATLAPADVMNAYRPTTGAPVFNGTPQNSAAAQVGQATAGGVAASAAPNAFIGPSQASAPAPMQAPAPYRTANASVEPPRDINPEGAKLLNGVPMASIRPGMNLATVGGDQAGSNFGLPTYYDSAKTLQVKPTDMIKSGTQVWIEGPTRMAEGGFTTARQFMAGDSLQRDPSAGGARPEVIENPTGAPIRVQGNPDNMMEMRGRYGAPGGGMGRPEGMGNVVQYGGDNVQREAPVVAQAPGWGGGDWRDLMARFRAEPQPQEPPEHRAARMAQARAQWAQSRARWAQYGGNWGGGGWNGGGPITTQPMMPRFALGTAAASQAQFQAQGMGDSFIPTSGNAYAAGQTEPMPNRLAMLARYGFPVTPSLYANTTGGVLPQSNMGSAFTVGRQAGVLPSLQSLNSMSPGETELYKGYAEGVAKVPWRDLVNYLGQATQNLKGAQRARAA